MDFLKNFFNDGEVLWVVEVIVQQVQNVLLPVHDWVLAAV